jgi:hypothetical protein
MKTRIAAAVCAVMLGLVPAAGCASDPLPEASSGKVDLSDPDQVIANALQTMFTWKPSVDDSADAAYRRAAIYLSDNLAREAENAPAPGAGSQWEQWRADGATVDAQAYFVADETPPNSEDQVHRVVVVIQSALTSDSRLIDEIRHTAWVTADKSGDGWRVTSIQF